jgi:threonine synthase
MGEGWTPLLVDSWEGQRVGFKLEGLSPTGSFKDRGASVLVSFLRGLGVREVVEDSSGNAGAALAAYGARAGLQVRIYAPAHTSPAKRRQIEAHGAQFVAVEGPRPRATEAALEAVAAGAYYASHAYSPFFLEGVATLTYEVMEQVHPQVPDHLLFPMGHGSLVASAYLALKRMQAAGEIERLPRLFVAQSTACAPLLEAWLEGRDEPRPVVPGPTVAEGITIGAPAWGWYALRAIRESGGAVVAVNDAEILAAQEALARRGLYVEPTAAVTVAALPHLKDRIAAHELVVLPLTGHGLKGH